MPDLHQSVASVVLDHSECAQVFARHRIDFCCRGEATVETAASEHGLDPAELLAELGAAIAARAGEAGPDPRELDTPALVERLVTVHHGYLRKVLPFLPTLGGKVARVHGRHNPKLVELARGIEALAATLLPHLDEEEHVLFPLLLADRGAGAARPHLDAMVAEHREVGELLERIRAAADDFALPEWACRSYRTLFAELEELERDVFTHVHLENHVLEPRFATA